LPLEKAEKTIIREALYCYGTSYYAKKAIAKELGISLATLYNKIEKYKLKDDEKV